MRSRGGWEARITHSHFIYIYIDSSHSLYLKSQHMNTNFESNYIQTLGVNLSNTQLSFEFR